MNFRRHRRTEERVDITPLIDIIFQLVLFFMVSTTFVTNPGIDVDLPRAAADALIEDQASVEVWMTVDGAVYVDQDPVDLAGLRGRLERAAQEDASTQVVVKADGGVDHRRVVTVLDLARSVGLTQLAIATDPGQDEP